MSFIDNIGKKLGEGVDWAKVKAEKFQRTFRIENELAEVRKQLDEKRLELSDRALDLYRAGQIQSPTLVSIVQGIDSLRVSVTLKEEELRRAQAEASAATTAGAPQTSQAQSVPISVETASSAPTASSSALKSCPNCGFQMPGTARFCPRCGGRAA